MSTSPSIGASGNPKHKRPGRLALLLMVLIGLALSQVAATQYLAGQFLYAPQLGEPIIGRVYGPWKFLLWSHAWWDYHPALFQRAGIIAAAIMIGTFGCYALVFFLTQRRADPNPALHGTAHWATRQDILAAGLLQRKRAQRSGVFVGGWLEGNRLHYLRHDGPEHIMLFAPTRSGKGVSLVLPTLLTWPHSTVVHDLKGENWALTAGWRQRHAGNRVLRFDPTATDGGSVQFNPLEEIRVGTGHEVADVQNLVTMIVDPDGKGLNDHWAKTGHALLTGAVLHLLYKARREAFAPALAKLPELLSDPARSIEAVLQEMLDYPHLPGDRPHPVVAASARDMLNKAENERSGVLSTAMSFLTLYRDPIVAQNTQRSQFRIADLMNHEQPVSLYLVVPPKHKDRLKPLMRLVINQIVRGLAEKLDFQDGRPVRHYRHRLLLMLDEFAGLGRLDVFQESLAFLAGYGIKAYLIVQDLAQLRSDSAYGRDESIISNCHIRVAFAPNKVETAELLSKMTGATTVIKKSISTSGKRLSALLGHVSESFHEIGRPLLTPDECMRLPGAPKDLDGKILEPGDMLIFPAGFPPIYGKQPLYFKDPVLSVRARLPAPARSDVIRAGAVETEQTDETRQAIDALFSS